MDTYDLILRAIMELDEKRVIVKDYNNPDNVDSETCARCGGICCKKCGCHFSPEDFKDLSYEGLKKEIEKGYISIDYVDGEIICSSYGAYILRIRNQGAPIVDTDYSRRAPCILLGKRGCKLTYEQRPAGAKLLIPNVVNNVLDCYAMYSIDDCCYEWKPYQKVLSALRQHFENVDIPCSI